MFKRLALLALAASLAGMAVAPAAMAGVDRFEVPIDGDTFDCGGEQLTVTNGTVKIAVHENESASGNTNLNVTIRPRGTLVDESGAKYKLVGAESVHVSTNANTGGVVVHEVFHVTIVRLGGGGAIGRVSEVFHMNVNPNGDHIVDVQLGSCEGPFQP